MASNASVFRRHSLVLVVWVGIMAVSFFSRFIRHYSIQQFAGNNGSLACLNVFRAGSLCNSGVTFSCQPYFCHSGFGYGQRNLPYEVIIHISDPLPCIRNYHSAE
jgi:hypothetical protein